jgi:hypothetical protein
MSQYYTVRASDGWPMWRVVPGGYSFMDFSTTDRRIARRVVRMARKLGYRVRF